MKRNIVYKITMKTLITIKINEKNKKFDLLCESQNK